MKRYLIIISTTVVVTSLFAISSCYNRKYDQVYPDTAAAVTCDTANVSYSIVIRPLVSQNCAKSGCHDPQTAEAGYDMTNYTGVHNATLNLSFACDLQHQSGCIPMPNDGTILTTCQINQLISWANAGAPDN